MFGSVHAAPKLRVLSICDMAKIGLIDFPARRPSGRPYYLCWLDGEDDITWWHWIDAGFAGRTPLSDPPA